MWERTWRGTRLLCVAICATLASGAVRGQDEGLSLVIELLRDADKDIRALALEQVRTEAKGEAATRKFAELLPALPPETQVGLLGALAARVGAARTGLDQRFVSISIARCSALSSFGSGGTWDCEPLRSSCTTSTSGSMPFASIERPDGV